MDKNTCILKNLEEIQKTCESFSRNLVNSEILFLHLSKNDLVRKCIKINNSITERFFFKYSNLIFKNKL